MTNNLQGGFNVMAFPFGESSPKKDFSKVSMDIVTTSTFLEDQAIDWLFRRWRRVY